MASNYFKVKKGLNLEPLATAVSAAGDMAYNSSLSTLEFYNGSVRTVVTRDVTETLSNKTLADPAVTGTLAGAAATFSTTLAATGNTALGAAPSTASQLSVSVSTAAVVSPTLIENRDFTAGNKTYLRVRQQTGASASFSAYLGVDLSGNVYLNADSTSASHLKINTTGNSAFSGNLGIGGDSSTAIGAFIQNTALATVNQTGVYSGITGTTAGTGTLNGFQSVLTTANSSYTVGECYGFVHANVTKQGSAAVTAQYAFFANALTSGGSNFGFYSNTAAASNRWNFYAAGTADNYFNGNIGIGVLSYGTSAAKVLGIGTGTPPSTGPADTIQLYSTDLSAGNTMLSLFTEGTPVSANATTTNLASRIAIRVNGTVYYLLAASTA